MTELEKLVRRWREGWSVARGWTDCTDLDGIIRLGIGKPDRMVEYFLTDEEPGRVERALRLALSDHHPAAASWITVIAQDATAVRSAFKAMDLEPRAPEWLMTAPLAEVARSQADSGRPSQPAEPYRVMTQQQAGLIDVRVVTGPDTGETPAPVAASGRMAVVGTDAVADMISTDPEHRRRGLGRAVMAALTSAAIEQGATDGVLLASQDGLPLYRGLGWSLIAEVVLTRSR